MEGQSLIVAGPEADLVPLVPVPAEPDMPQRPRDDLEVRAGPCTQRGLSLVEHPAPGDTLVSAPRGLVLAPALVLARPAPASAVQVV